MSMRNELRGSKQNEADWYKYMQQGANTINTQSPNFLVIVSGLNYVLNLGFIKSKPLEVNFTNKLVFEAHWYTFGIPAQRWINQTNNLCAAVTKSAQNNYLYLTQGNNSFPLFLSEFGASESGDNVAGNRYITCLRPMSTRLFGLYKAATYSDKANLTLMSLMEWLISTGIIQETLLFLIGCKSFSRSIKVCNSCYVNLELHFLMHKTYT